VSVRIRFNPKHNHYGLWDPETGWVDKHGRASDDYYAETREVAIMRRRDLNQWRKEVAARRNVTAEPPTDTLTWDEFSGRGDPKQRFRLYRLCECAECEGKGRGTYPMQLARWEVEYGVQTSERCPICRGEGRTLELVATCASAEAVGVTLVTLGREGEWSECPVGVLDTEGETGQKWLVSPWLPSPRNVSDAGRLLRSRR